MSLKPLWADDFPSRSALARRGPADVPAEEIVAELLAELHHRQAAYPDMVARGKLKAEDAARHTAAWHAIVADWQRERMMAGAPAYSLDWDTRVRELRRELAMRRNLYPRRVASATHPLTAGEAARKLECLDAAHFRYWRRLFAFVAPGTPSAIAAAMRAAWIAGDECRHRSPEWDAAIAGDGIDASEAERKAARAARRDAAAWRAIHLFARIRAGEDTGYLPPLAATIGRLRDAAETRLRAQADMTERHESPEWILGQLHELTRWLRREAARAGVPATPPAPFHAEHQEAA